VDFVCTDDDFWSSCTGDDASEGHDGGEDQGYHSDFKRGKRLRKLMRLLGSKQAEKVPDRFYSHTVMVTVLVMVIHLACFIASVVLLESQKSFITEVDDAGSAVIAMHRMAIDCR
jgi:hypothetical protein